MKKVLWLTSWYPNKTDMFTGDFIQRHAKAASLHNEIIVLHVAKAENNFFDTKIHEELNHTENLIEHIVYFKCNLSFKPINKLISLLKYHRLFKKLIISYLKIEKRPELVHVHVPLKAGLLALWVKKKYKIAYVLTDHYGIYNNLVDEPFDKRSFLFKYFTRKIINEAEIFSPVSKNMGNTINKILLDKPFSVIYNTVDESLFYYQKNANEKFRFIHVSNLAPLKNVEAIIRCIAELSVENQDFELVIVGKHSDRVFKLANETGLLDKTIFFAGEVSYADVAAQMQQSHSLILFSKTENMPCVVLEALCCGLPVIVTNVGGVPEVVNNSNGMVIESENETALKHAVVEMMERYAQFDRENISRDAITKFSYETIGKQISEMYHQAISRQPH